MFSDLYYLSKLIDNSLSFSKIEKQRIFYYAKNNEDKILLIIKTFEDEQVGFDFIKNDYQKKIIKIGENYREDLEKEINNREIKEREKRRDIIKNMKIIELEEKSSENIDTLINNI